MKSLRLSATLLALTALFLSVSCKRAVPDDVVAVVNEKAITIAELEKFHKSNFPNQPPSQKEDDELLRKKLELLRDMIDSEIMMQRAEKQGLIATDADVEAKLNEFRAPYTQEEFQKQLDARGFTIEDLKTQIRRDQSVRRLFNKEITSRVNISDQDVKEFYETNKASFNLAEPQFHIAQILVTPRPDDDVRNLKNDNATDAESARRKIQMLDARLKQGEDFSLLAQNYSEDPNTNQNGGDIGFIPESALANASPDLRRAVLSLQPGQNSNIIATPEGLRIFRLISREPAGQRELNDPRVQQAIRNTLINLKDQLLQAAYYEVSRNEAKVINYYAEKVIAQAAPKN
ncbi:MAG: peptidylprolyl isomerase [Bryobacterales bacterium]|nr:peptidylprolyl isomerase [Bryobacterales bacterium]